MPSKISSKAKKNARSPIQYSLWDEWNPRSYLNTYFETLGQDSIENLKFLIRELAEFKDSPKQKILDFGAGPTIFSGLLGAPYATEITFADYLESNLKEIDKWLHKKPDAFNWNNYTRYILKLENNLCSELNIRLRHEELRRKARIIRCDASLEKPLIHSPENFSLVISNFCADSSTDSKAKWKTYMKNIASLVAPSGTLLLSALRNCTYYKNGSKFFPCANINESDLKEFLIENNFLGDFKLEVSQTPSCESEGFNSLILVKAIKSS